MVHSCVTFEFVATRNNVSWIYSNTVPLIWVRRPAKTNVKARAEWPALAGGANLKLSPGQRDRPCMVLEPCATVAAQKSHVQVGMRKDPEAPTPDIQPGK